MQKPSLYRKILLGLAAVGPGLFLIGYNIGTGSVTTMAKTGAEHGMTLLWALVLSCIFTYVLMIAYGRLTLVTGQTALYNFKEAFRGGWILSIYILAALILGELLALMGIMGIVAELMQEGIRLLTGSLVHTAWIIGVCAVLIYLLIRYGRYQTFEQVLTFFVVLMGLSFIVVFFLVKPSLSSLLQGMSPGIPDTPGAYGLVAAIAGTTCSAAVFIMRSVVVAEKGWGIADLQQEKKDALVSAGTMLLLSAVIMAVAAGTLHVAGLRLDNTIEMIELLQPIGGKAAAFILIVGITGAGLSTVFPIVLIAPWLLADYRGTPRNIHSRTSQGLIVAGLALAFGSVFLEQRPPALMVFSQAFQACILPAVAIPVFLLLNRSSTMQQYRAGKLMNVGLIAVILFAFITTWLALAEFFG